MSSMQVVIDARMVDSKGFGLGRYVYNLLKNLIKIDQANQYTLLVNDDFLAPLVANASNFNLLKVNIPWLSVFEQIKIPWVIRKLKPDLFHATSFSAPMLQPYPTIVTICDLIHLVFPEHYSLLHKFYFKFFLKKVLNKAKRVITISECSKRDIISHYNIPQEKVTVTYLAVEESFQPIGEQDKINDFKQRMGLPKRFILYVGTRKKHKNIAGLIKAYSLLPREDCFLVLSGSMDQALLDLIKKYKVEDRVVCIGKIEDSELPLLYNAADLFVFPSRYEGFGLPPLEAMACGVPVVTSNAASLPEVVGDAARLVDPDNSKEMAMAMSKVLNQENLRKELIQKGIMRARLFSWEKCARETLNLYKEASK